VAALTPSPVEAEEDEDEDNKSNKENAEQVGFHSFSFHGFPVKLYILFFGSFVNSYNIYQSYPFATASLQLPRVQPTPLLLLSHCDHEQQPESKWCSLDVHGYMTIISYIYRTQVVCFLVV
jgi:hypothetical protein